MIVFLVEDFSMKKFLEGILPRLGFESYHFEIKFHQGKEDLKCNLDKTIPTLSKRANQIIILIDQDTENCLELKNNIKEKMWRCSCEYKIRIACYELEAWFLGDMDAIKQCSERFNPDSYRNKEEYRNIDAIYKPKPSTHIEKIVPDLKKIYSSKDKFAAEISKHINLENQVNKSYSFNVFLETIKSIKA